MKPRKHRHKESFSILLISNTGQNSRQFHVTHSFVRLFTVFVLLICATFGWLMYQYVSGFGGGVVSSIGSIVGRNESSDGNEEQEELLGKIAAQEKTIAALEKEKESLGRQNDALTSENKALLAAAKGNMGANAEGQEQTAEDDTAYPSRFPYSKQGILTTKYSEEHPYVSIDTNEEGDIIAAGDGTVAMVGSDETYPLIIEIEHGNGYRTRYMFLQDAQAQQTEGAQVQIGAVLAAVDVHNVQVDYQVIYEDQPIDPLIVFEAKG